MGKGIGTGLGLGVEVRGKADGSMPISGLQKRGGGC